MSGLSISRQRRRARLIMMALALALLILAAFFVLRAFEENLVYFVTPSEISSAAYQPGNRLRLGGLVAEGSVKLMDNGVVHFGVTDGAASISVEYQGILPDLFREGQGVVSEGVLSPQGVFQADTVLAKHDETYMPTEVAEALKEQGVWQGEADK